MSTAFILGLLAAVSSTPDAIAQADPQAAPAVVKQIAAFEALQKQRLSIALTKETQPQWMDMRRRERELLNAAYSASSTDADLRVVFNAAVGHHSDMALEVARRALKQRTTTEWWHHTGIAASAYTFSHYVQDPEKTELLNEAKRAVADGLELKGDSWVWLLAGQIHEALSDWRTAKSAFSLAMQTGLEAQDRPAAVRGLWRSTSALNELTEADGHWAEFLKTGAASDQDHLDRGHFLGAAGRYSEAAAVFEMLARNPVQRTTSPTHGLWFLAAGAHRMGGRLRETLAAAAETVKTAPGGPESARIVSRAHVMAANIFVEMAEIELAEHAGRNAVQADPAFASAHMQLAQVYVKAKRFTEAEREARRALELVTESEASPHLVLAEIFFAQSRWADAAKSYEHAARVHETNPYPSYSAGIAYERAGRTTDAIRCYEEALRREPNIKERGEILAAIARLKR